NGARCLARFALALGLGRAGAVTFRTDVGVKRARVTDDGRIALWFGPVEDGEAVTLGAVGRTFAGRRVVTGVPHFVVPVPRVDREATARLVEHMIDGGVQGLVVSGSTGEAATCSVEERRELWAFVRDRAKKRAWVVAGTGTNSTADSIVLTRMAEELGLDGAMVVTPYYNKPTPKGQAAHFSAVAKSTKLPLILYNVPGRTGTNTTPDVLAMVQDLPNVKAVKEASGNLDQMAQVKTRTRLTLLSGDDALTLPCAAVGGEGIVSVVGQAAPKQMRALSDLSRAGEPVAA